MTAFINALRRIRACETEAAAQLVLEHFLGQQLGAAKSLWCSYCFREFERSESSWDLLQAHIRECSKHPLAAAITTLRNFANPENWHCVPGSLSWQGKRNAVEYAQTVLDDLEGKTNGNEISHQ